MCDDAVCAHVAQAPAFSQIPATAEQPEAASKVQVSRKELFVSQLARKHPVAFFQLLDLCARSDQLTGNSTYILADLAEVGSAKIGVKGLADLLSSPTATAALGSSLCSIAKLQLQEIKQVAGRSHMLALLQCVQLTMRLEQLSGLLQEVAQKAAAVTPAEAANSSGGSHSSSDARAFSRGQQGTASSLFLAVLLSRILVALDDAAAGAVAAAAALWLDAADTDDSVVHAACAYMQSALKVFCLLHDTSMPQHVLHLLQVPVCAQSSRSGDAAATTGALAAAAAAAAAVVLIPAAAAAAAAGLCNGSTCCGCMSHASWRLLQSALAAPGAWTLPETC
jgi:hypothetical protein